MSELISKYECDRVLEAAFKMTGNQDFIKIKERMKVMQDICDLANKVCYQYPTGHGYRDDLEKLIRERQKDTSDFVKVVGGFE